MVLHPRGARRQYRRPMGQGHRVLAADRELGPAALRRRHDAAAVGVPLEVVPSTLALALTCSPGASKPDPSTTGTQPPGPQARHGLRGSPTHRPLLATALGEPSPTCSPPSSETGSPEPPLPSPPNPGRERHQSRRTGFPLRSHTPPPSVGAGQRRRESGRHVRMVANRLNFSAHSPQPQITVHVCAAQGPVRFAANLATAYTPAG